MNINGFEIEVFNQYGLKENAKYSTCPICSESRKKKDQKCLMLNWELGLGTCQHCGEVLQLHTFKKKNENKNFVKPPVKENNTQLSDKLVKWFESRKISQFTLRKMKISEGVEWMPQLNKKVNTIHFNYYRENELINIKYRDARKNFKLFKDAEKILYNLDLIATSKDVVIVEGEMDALSYVEAGVLNVVSTPNGSTLKGVNLDCLDNSIEFLENKDRFYLALDNDEAGQNVQKEMIRRLGAERCYLIDFKECKDANEYLIKYGRIELAQTVKDAKIIPLENVLTAQSLREKLHHFYLNGLDGGYKCGIKSLDEKYSIISGQIEMVTGIPTHGKSELVDSRVIGLNLINKFKCAFASPENKPTELHLDKICKKIAGFQPKTLEEINSEIWKQTENYVDNNYYFIDFEDGYDLETVLNKVKELVFRKGIKTFVLDPYNKIRYKGELIRVTGITTVDYTSTYLNYLADFVRKYDLICFLVAHPNKMSKENGVHQMPTFYDIKGSGEFYDMLNFGLTVYRNFAEKRTIVKILKCKFAHLGENGAEIELAYNPKNGRYCEIDSNGLTKYDNSFWLAPKEPEQTEIDIEPNYNWDNPEPPPF